MKAEINYGLNIERSANKPKDHYKISKSSFLGNPMTHYTPIVPIDSRSAFDHLDYTHKPYLVALTLLIESPMKLFV